MTSYDGGSIYLYMSKDVEIDGVTNSCATHMGTSVGRCTGKVTFRNYKIRTKDGEANACCRDGLHYWQNRATLLVEDSEFWTCLDDHINTKAKFSAITAVDAENPNICTLDAQSLDTYVGDKLLFVAHSSFDVSYGYAFVKSVTALSNAYRVELDRPVPEALVEMVNKKSANTSAGVFSCMNNGSGTAIRGTKFFNCRRHAYISRSHNTIFMNNYIQNNAGCTLDAGNEAGFKEGPFPSAYTMRNNRVYGDGISEKSDVPAVVAVRTYGDGVGIEPEIDGALISGNIIQVNTGLKGFYVNGVKDLYMTNNTLLWNDAWDSNIEKGKYLNYVPVDIINCGIKQIDGLVYDTPAEVKSVVRVFCSKLDSDIKNITVRKGNQSTLYTVK